MNLQPMQCRPTARDSCKRPTQSLSKTGQPASPNWAIHTCNKCNIRAFGSEAKLLLPQSRGSENRRTSAPAAHRHWSSVQRMSRLLLPPESARAPGHARATADETFVDGIPSLAREGRRLTHSVVPTIRCAVAAAARSLPANREAAIGLERRQDSCRRSSVPAQRSSLRSAAARLAARALS